MSDSLRWLTLFGAAAASLGAQAQEEVVTLRAQRTLIYDSNLLRVPEGTNTQPLVGQPDASERIDVTLLGMSLNKELGLQKFEADLNLTDYAFDRFRYLDYTASNLRAAWFWALTPDLQGVISHDRQQSLNSFADTTNYAQRNLLTQTNRIFNANYRLAAAWRLQASVSRYTENRSIPQLAEGETVTRYAGAGVQYLWPSGSSLTVGHRMGRGDYLNRSLPSLNLSDVSFRQPELSAQWRWQWRDDSYTQFDVRRLERQHPNYPQRDYSGTNVDVLLSWQASGRTQLQAGWQQQVASYQTGSSNYSRTRQIFLGPVYSVSDKTKLNARLQRSQVDYLGTPGPVPAVARSDGLSNFLLGVSWQANQRLRLSGSWAKGKRSSNLPGLDFDYRTSTLQLDFSY